MSHPYSDILSWIDSQHQQMILLVTRWAEINSGTGNVEGLSAWPMRSAWN